MILAVTGPKNPSGLNIWAILDNIVLLVQAFVSITCIRIVYYSVSLDGFHLIPRVLAVLSLSNSSIALLIDESGNPFNNSSLLEVHFLSVKPPPLATPLSEHESLMLLPLSLLPLSNRRRIAKGRYLRSYGELILFQVVV